jgi:hypothetical protein
MTSGLSLSRAGGAAGGNKPAPMMKQMSRAISMSIRSTPIKASGDVAEARWKRLANLVDDESVMTEADQELSRLEFSEENEDEHNRLSKINSLAMEPHQQSPVMGQEAMSERTTVSTLTPVNVVGGGVMGADVSGDFERLRSEVSELRAQIFSSEQQVRKHIDKGMSDTQKMLAALDQKLEKLIHPDSDSSGSESEKDDELPELKPASQRRASTYASRPRSS